MLGRVSRGPEQGNQLIPGHQGILSHPPLPSPPPQPEPAFVTKSVLAKALWATGGGGGESGRELHSLLA